MKNRFTKFISLVICAIMIFGSMGTVIALADDSSEMSWDDIWKNLGPEYLKTPYESVSERIIGQANIGNNSEFNQQMDLMAVINGYAFYCDKVTGEMIFLVLKDKTLTKDKINATYEEKLAAGEFYVPDYTAFYCTNPYNAGDAKASSGTASANSQKELLLSQLIIEYSANDKPGTMSSFADAASYDQIEVKNIRNGVRVEYSIGRENVTYLVPRLITKARYEALLEEFKMNCPDNFVEGQFEGFYKLYDPADSFASTSINALKGDYPALEKMACYLLDPSTSTAQLARLEAYVKEYTGYDYETLDADHAETEYVDESVAPPLFKLALEYRVDGNEITVRCNAANIRFNSSLYKLNDVLVLPYGGAGEASNEGYILSPDGSGSLIAFEDMSAEFTIANSLYGQDYAYHTISGQNKEVTRLPVFGVYQSIGTKHAENAPEVEEEGSESDVESDVSDDTNSDENVNEENGSEEIDENAAVSLDLAYLAVIEEGDSLAKINIAYGGSKHNFASVYTSFNPRPKDSYVLDGGISAGSTDAMWTVESKRKYTGDFKLRLFILDGTEDGDKATAESAADKSYSDMAAAYRNYLVDSGVLSKVSDLESNVPLYIETLGAIESTTTVLGMPVTTTVALTSFSDTVNILKTLKDTHKIDNVKIKMNGWYNGGLMGDVATSIEIEEVLGGEEEFKNLVKYAKENNVTLFPDIELGLAYNDKAFDKFDVDDHLAKTIDDRNAFRKAYDSIYQGFGSTGEGIISSGFMSELYDYAYEDYGKFEVGAISIGTLGKYLSSDFNSDDPLTREDSKELVIQLLQKIKKNNAKILVTAGNEYTLPYATDILEIPLDDSRLLTSYATVPFMSMVLHSYKEYAGIALNLAGDYDYYLLKTIESGASPYFVIAANNTSELKQYASSSLNKYYSVRYSIWLSDIVEAYNAVNNAISDVQSAALVKHQILTADGKVARVEYDNGVVFYVNYGEEAYNVDEYDVDVPVNGYVKIVGNSKPIVWEGV